MCVFVEEICRDSRFLRSVLLLGLFIMTVFEFGESQILEWTIFLNSESFLHFWLSIYTSVCRFIFPVLRYEGLLSHPFPFFIEMSPL